MSWLVIVEYTLKNKKKIYWYCVFLLKFTNSKRLIIYHDNINCLHIAFSLYVSSVRSSTIGDESGSSWLLQEIFLSLVSRCCGFTYTNAFTTLGLVSKSVWQPRNVNDYNILMVGHYWTIYIIMFMCLNVNINCDAVWSLYVTFIFWGLVFAWHLFQFRQGKHVFPVVVMRNLLHPQWLMILLMKRISQF
jgi:hypothetical protein